MKQPWYFRHEYDNEDVRVLLLAPQQHLCFQCFCPHAHGIVTTFVCLFVFL